MCIDYFPEYIFIRRAEGVRDVFVNGQRAYNAVSGYTDARGGAIVPQAA